ncbi:DUF1294 domain-containing protein [Rhodovulum sp. DZ06]|uniref:DUF1294 domain-containing protein n=1 Tax=Rhodovulum sp. DZ06 TaxID=3425126 RepID=UPI003D340BAE
MAERATGPWLRGRVVSWNDARGFGFLRPDQGEGGDMFVHIAAFGRTGERPQLGSHVKYRVGPGRDGRPAAVAARLDEGGLLERRFLPRLRPREGRIAFAALMALLAVGAVVFGEAPPELLGPYVAMGAMSIIFYRTDKAQAVKDGWRAPETTLHATDLVFGVIGGLFAQGWFGHKTSKPGYFTVTAIIAAGHAALLIAAGVGAMDTVKLAMRLLGLVSGGDGA